MQQVINAWTSLIQLLAIGQLHKAAKAGNRSNMACCSSAASSVVVSRLSITSLYWRWCRDIDTSSHCYWCKLLNWFMAIYNLLQSIFSVWNIFCFWFNWPTFWTNSRLDQIPKCLSEGKFWHCWNAGFLQFRCPYLHQNTVEALRGCDCCWLLLYTCKYFALQSTFAFSMFQEVRIDHLAIQQKSADVSLYQVLSLCLCDWLLLI